MGQITKQALFLTTLSIAVIIGISSGANGRGILQVLGPDVPQTNFSCEGRVAGYYADVGSGCQVYHMCDGRGRQFSYSCPNRTLFQQRMMVCDHWYMVNCSVAELDYSANLLLGQKNKLFIETEERVNRGPVVPIKTVPNIINERPFYSPGRKQKPAAIDADAAQSFPSFATYKSTTARSRPKTTSLPYKFVSKTSFPPYSPTPSQVFGTTHSAASSTSARNVLPSGKVNLPQVEATTQRSDESGNIPLAFIGRGRKRQRRPQFSQQNSTLLGIYQNNPFFQSLGNQNSSFRTRENTRSFLRRRTTTTTVAPPTAESQNILELRLLDTRRMFFIPDYDLDERHDYTFVKRINLETDQELDDLDHPHHHGVMKFRSFQDAAKRNPACPQCHPDFLDYGECSPCVIIR